MQYIMPDFQRKLQVILKGRNIVKETELRIKMRLRYKRDVGIIRPSI